MFSLAHDIVFIIVLTDVNFSIELWWQCVMGGIEVAAGVSSECIPLRNAKVIITHQNFVGVRDNVYYLFCQYNIHRHEPWQLLT